MNLGVFGDSYADITGATHLLDESLGRIPWPITLASLLDMQLHAHGAIATSTWFSYKRFLKEYKNMDAIVFCYSSNDRWHNINTDEVAPIYHIVSPDQLNHVIPEYKSLVKKLIDVHPIIFDLDLNRFVVQNVFDSVNELCRQNNIKIVNILTFEEISDFPLEFDISKNAGTVLTNLVAVSGAEYQTPYGVPRDKDIHHQITNFYDKRFCHLSPYNNAILAQIIKECIENNVEYKNLFTDDRFSYDVEHNRYIVE